MKAAIIRAYGRTDVLKICDIARPTPGPDEVLVKVVAASINPRDWLLMRGIYQAKRFVEPLPATLGSDFSGIITVAGNNVMDFKIGDAVFGMQPLKGKFGAFAEYIKINTNVIARKPQGISHSDAAAMPCAGMTSYQTLHHLAKVQVGETVLINGASGGVGVYAIQIAKALGARVIAVCSSANASLCSALGAEAVIDYRTENFIDRVATFDVVYDVIGRTTPKDTLACLKPGGRYITTIPGIGTAITAAKSWLFCKIFPGKRKTAHLVMVKPRPDDLSALAEMIINGSMKTVIDSIHSLADIETAFERSQSWRTRGKIIIDVAGFDKA